MLRYAKLLTHTTPLLKPPHSNPPSACLSVSKEFHSVLYNVRYHSVDDVSAENKSLVVLEGHLSLGRGFSVYACRTGDLPRSAGKRTSSASSVFRKRTASSASSRSMSLLLPLPSGEDTLTPSGA